MLIDLFLISGISYTIYVVVKSILTDDINWIAYQPKHAKRSKVVALLQFGKEEIL